MSYINIKGRGLKFNQGALVTFQKKLDHNDIEGTSGYALIYAGLKANAYVKGEEFTETFEQVCDWTDKLSEQELLSILKCFQETQAYKNLLPKEEDDNKKKLQVKNMKRNASK